MSEQMRERVTEVERQGLRFLVRDAGPVDGEPVVLLHGFPERSSSWDRVAPLLNAAGYRTLAMDQRGYSPAARPPRRRDYRVHELARDVVALVDAAAGPDGRAHVVGHDWGAVVAWATAIRHADRVRTLTAVSVGHPQAFLQAMVRSDQLKRSSYMAFFNLPWLPEKVLASDRGRAMLRRGGMTASDVERYRREVVEDGALPTALNWYRALPLSGPGGLTGTVRVPTTMVWSDRDVALGRWGAEHSADHVDAPFRFVELPGVSHWIPTEAPEALAEAILDRVRGPAADSGPA